MTCDDYKTAADYLRRQGYLILEMSCRPIQKDQRKEIPIVAYDRSADTLVFVAVFPHDSIFPLARRMPSRRRFVTQMRKTGRTYARIAAWENDTRCDTIDVYRDVETIDHTIGAIDS